ncbi:MAG: CocE/NonD family hydrolase [Candidatus Abyssobacteria bacterium SURF_5]|uniref:CocE/NonD family hydrolase n=1 Tax=Abyssobacteria bacterium (strain SURF_5) TaxID=2093360 RepID=A0A3A4NS72_ABYX5|nr:MAG: CocE/NonD family hydrolase [Candidatus Abyssubacteria bacterium SURF_5]
MKCLRNFAVPLKIFAASLCLLVVIAQSSFGEESEVKQSKTFFKADLQWKLYQLTDKFDKYFKLPCMRIENGTPDRYDRIEVEKNVPIPMRDGVRLSANIYRPKGPKAESKFPVILTRLPYGKDEYYCWMPAIGKFWAKKGYVFVAQDVRGKFCSEGEFDPLINEADDGYDTLDWIAAQPWCDGNIGMEGESYYGYTTWAGAVTGHPNLKCVSPMNTAMDFHDLMFQNGALTLQTLGLYPIWLQGKAYQNFFRLDRMHLPLITMDDAAGIPTPRYDTILRHPLRDEVTESYNLRTRRERVEIPILVVAGWYDVFLKAAIDDWLMQRQKNMETGAKEKQWILIAPIDHEWTPTLTNRIGRLDIGDKCANTTWEVRQAFYDKYLKGIDNGFEKTSPVHIFVIGDNDWRDENEWPLARTQCTDYYLHSAGSANTLDGDGMLNPDAPLDEPFDTYVYDPQDPVKIHYDIDLWALAAEMKDRRAAEEREDVLVYTSAPLENEMEITGPISVTLYAASSAVDTDFTAALVDVFPDGYLHLIQEGIQRASVRESATAPTPLEPEKIYEYKIDLWATSYVLKAGHKIRVEISSSNFDRFDRNLNTGAEFAMSSETERATQRIYHSQEHPSHITLPVIPR